MIYNYLVKLNDIGVEIVTLGACGHSALLYERLGFKRNFNNTVMKLII